MTAADPSDVQAWIALARAHSAVLRHVEAALKGADLPPLGWYDVLLELDRAGPDGLRPFALEERLLLPQYGLSRLVDRMVAAGLVVRRTCLDDRRGHMVTLTPEGAAMRARIWPAYRAALATAIGGKLGERDREALIRLLRSLA